MVTRFLGITGPKKSGKTTTIEMLVQQLSKKGLRIGTVKIAFKDVSIDVNEEHYDVVRHRKAGPAKTLFKSRIDTTIFLNEKYTLREALREFEKDLDLVLVEGFKENLEGIPQVVLLKEKDQEKAFTDSYTAIVSSIPEFDVQSRDRRFIPFENLAEKVLSVALPLYPGLDCIHCGFNSCNRMVQAVIAGRKDVNDCIILVEKEQAVQLQVNDIAVPLNPFVQKILKNNVLAIVETLKLEGKELQDIEVKIDMKQIIPEKKYK